MHRTLYRVLIATIGALLLIACDAAETTEEGAGTESPAADQEGTTEAGEADDAEEAAPADENGAGESAAEEGPAEGEADVDGFVRIDGEEHPLTLALNCEPRESSTLMDPRTPGSEVDGTIEFRTMALGEEEFAIDVWEQTTDGVRAQRVYSLNLLGPERSIAAEGDEGYPLFEVDGDRVTVEARHPVDADEYAEVYAEWTFPDDHSNC